MVFESLFYNLVMKLLRKKYIGILLMLLCAVCLCLGQLIWKVMPGYNFPNVILGFIIYAIGALFMILAYRYGELSALQPINSMSYVFSTILAIIVLGEKILPVQFMGIILIICGVVIIGASTH